MEKLTMALTLATQGFFVFPLMEKSKQPAVKDWPSKATRDPETIRAWWINRPECNIGIFTEKFGDGRALLVIDVDNKGDKSGDDELFKLQLEGKELPEPHMEVQTPTGGRHIIYIVDTPVKQGANVLGPGIDIRSKGGYIVAAGSVL